jgi:hypothetical protein
MNAYEFSDSGIRIVGTSDRASHFSCFAKGLSMPGAHREYSIALSLVIVLLAIGVPALQRGQRLVGGICVGLALLFALWTLVEFLRDRR